LNKEQHLFEDLTNGLSYHPLGIQHAVAFIEESQITGIQHAVAFIEESQITLAEISWLSKGPTN